MSRSKKPQSKTTVELWRHPMSSRLHRDRRCGMLALEETSGPVAAEILAVENGTGRRWERRIISAHWKLATLPVSRLCSCRAR